MSQQEQASQSYSLLIWYLLNYKTGGKSLGCVKGKQRVQSSLIASFSRQVISPMSFTTEVSEVGRVMIWMELMYLYQESPTCTRCNAFDGRFFMSSMQTYAGTWGKIPEGCL